MLFAKVKKKRQYYAQHLINETVSRATPYCCCSSEWHFRRTWEPKKDCCFPKHLIERKQPDRAPCSIQRGYELGEAMKHIIVRFSWVKRGS